jgi:DNA repair protein RecO (recombination protein O)
MIKKTEGIVLRNFPIGEADLIVTYISRDFGILKVFAKSPRKIKSRFGSSLEPLTYSKISFIGKEDANLPKLIQSDIIKPFQPLREDFKCFNLLSDVIKIILDLLPERECNIKVFKLFRDMLLRLEPDCRRAFYHLYLKIKLLEITGYLPMLYACGKCGEEIGVNNSFKSLANFYPVHGSVICERCGSDLNNYIKISKGALIFFRSIIKWNSSNICRIKAPDLFISEIENIINAHIKYILSGNQNYIEIA